MLVCEEELMSDMEQADLEWLTTGQDQYVDIPHKDVRLHEKCGGKATYFTDGRLFKHYICERCKTQLSFRR